MTVRSSSSLKISGRVGHRRDDQADTRRVALWVMPRRRPSGAVRTISVGKITYFPTRYLPRSLAGSSYLWGSKTQTETRVHSLYISPVYFLYSSVAA
jgi:hypothetical protein